MAAYQLRKEAVGMRCTQYGVETRSSLTVLEVGVIKWNWWVRNLERSEGGDCTQYRLYLWNLPPQMWWLSLVQTAFKGDLSNSGRLAFHWQLARMAFASPKTKTGSGGATEGGWSAFLSSMWASQRQLEASLGETRCWIRWTSRANVINFTSCNMWNNALCLLFAFVLTHVRALNLRWVCTYSSVLNSRGEMKGS